jgi:Sulphur transport
LLPAGRLPMAMRNATLMNSSLVFAITLLLAAIMGFAIQRGATCTVAAVDEWVNCRRTSRLVSMVEASIWVAAGLVIANAIGVLRNIPNGYPVSISVIIGGVLLGVGAYVNQACVFGAIARLGAGEWSYLATPAGFYAGCASVNHLFPQYRQLPLAEGSSLFHGSAILAAVVLALMLLRTLWPIAMLRASLQQATRISFAERVWSPHVATTVIGISFLFLLLMAGAWAYTDVLAEVARGVTMKIASRSLLLLALFLGAVSGGLSAGRFHSRLSVIQLGKCFAGGTMMGWGSLLIPGSNDGLILLGMPLLFPYAWVAFAVMCVSIGLAMLASKRWALRRSAIYG